MKLFLMKKTLVEGEKIDKANEENAKVFSNFSLTLLNTLIFHNTIKQNIKDPVLKAIIKYTIILVLLQSSKGAILEIQFLIHWKNDILNEIKSLQVNIATQDSYIPTKHIKNILDFLVDFVYIYVIWIVLYYCIY